MRKTVAALALVLVAALGVAVPSVAAATGDPKVVIIVGATQGATAGYRADADVAYAEAMKYTPNVVKVYSPNATWAKVKAAVVGASVVIYLGHGNGWPSPYTYDAEVHDQGRLRAQRHGRRGRLQQQVLRRAVDRHARPRAGRPGDPQSPVLRLGQLRAGQPRAERHGRPPAGRQLRRRLPEGRRRSGHRRRSRGLRALPPGAVHDPPVDRGPVADDPGRQRQHRQLRLEPGRPARWSSRTRSPRPPASIARSRSAPSGVTTDEVVSAGYGDTGVDPTSLVVPGNASVSTDGASLFTSLDTLDRLGRDAAGRHASARRRRARPGDRHGRDPRPGRRRSTIRRSPASWPPPTSTRATARRPSSASSTRARRSRPTATGRVTSRRCAAASPNRSTGSSRSRTARRHVLFEKTGTGSTFTTTWDGLVGGHPGRGRPVHGRRQRGRRLGATRPPTRRGQVTVDTAAPQPGQPHPGGRHRASGSRRTATASATRSAVTATNSENGALVATGPRRQLRRHRQLDDPERHRPDRAHLGRPQVDPARSRPTASTRSGCRPVTSPATAGRRSTGPSRSSAPCARSSRLEVDVLPAGQRRPGCQDHAVVHAWRGR